MNTSYTREQMIQGFAKWATDWTEDRDSYRDLGIALADPDYPARAADRLIGLMEETS